MRQVNILDVRQFWISLGKNEPVILRAMPQKSDMPRGRRSSGLGSAGKNARSTNIEAED
jgi:hypothetical protein